VSVRVALYGEGGGDTAGEIRVRPRPRDELVEEWLGPAHILVRRAIVRTRPQLPSGAIRFEEPLRAGGRLARGSHLVHGQTLRQLLTWVAAPPDLAIVLVDRDGVVDRRATLLEAIRDLPLMRAIGVAVEELESWLIGDPQALAQVLPASTSPPDIESLAPRAAKALLQQWSASQPEKTGRQVRLSLAGLSDLEMLERRCPSFARFALDLSAALPQ